MFKNLKITLTISTFLFALCVTNDEALAETTTNPFVDALQNSKNIKEFILAADEVKTHLRVPISYIDETSTEGHGQTTEEASINLKMVWPSLDPTPVNLFVRNSKEYDAKQKLLLSGHWFTIEFHQGKNGANSRDLNLKNWWTPWPDAPPIPGFTQYVDGVGLNSTVKNHSLGTRILIPTDKSIVDWVYYVCPVNSPFSPTGLYCVGNIGVGHKVYVEYTFSMADIEDWKRIDQTVRQLYNAMYVSQLN